jgi:hypothetical protein
MTAALGHVAEIGMTVDGIAAEAADLAERLAALDGGSRQQP